jgi:hypothetical protein
LSVTNEQSIQKWPKIDSQATYRYIKYDWAFWNFADIETSEISTLPGLGLVVKILPGLQLGKY